MGTEKEKKTAEYKKAEMLANKNAELEALVCEYAWAMVEHHKNEGKKFKSELQRKKRRSGGPEGMLKKLHMEKSELIRLIEKSRDEMEDEQAEYLNKKGEVETLQVELKKQKIEEKKANSDIKIYQKKTQQLA